MLRGQHPKSVGFVVANFIVEKDVPEELRVGVFKRPEFRYGAVVRFSNARLNDKERDGHGMCDQAFRRRRREAHAGCLRDEHRRLFSFSITLSSSSGTPSTTSTSKRAELGDGQVHGRDQQAVVGGFVSASNQPLHLDEANSDKAAYQSPRCEYWSIVPYRLGHHVVKYRVIPDTKVSRSSALRRTRIMRPSCRA